MSMNAPRGAGPVREPRTHADATPVPAAVNPTSTPAKSAAGTLGIVVIGRNEGERLKRCLRSLVGGGHPIVYVDSGSTDGSVAFARSLGVEVLELPMNEPFTMARGRNAGLEHLLARHPGIELVQFVDGDCEVAAGWLEGALEALTGRPDVAAVCGRRRERFPEASIYNRLIDMEWDGPVGEVEACGGDALMRVAALRQAGPFNPALIAGEEPELCVRLRRHGWRILRLPREMTLHDAAVTRFGQMWKRVVRTGHAYAEGAALHGRSPERHNVRAVRSLVAWGLLLPAAIVLTAAAACAGLAPWPAAPAMTLLYALLFLRIFIRQCRAGTAPRDATAFALFCVLGKFPQALGALTYWRNRLRKRRTALIEYKSGS